MPETQHSQNSINRFAAGKDSKKLGREPVTGKYFLPSFSCACNQPLVSTHLTTVSYAPLCTLTETGAKRCSSSLKPSIDAPNYLGVLMAGPSAKRASNKERGLFLRVKSVGFR